MIIIAYPVEFCQDSKTEKNAGLPLDKPEKNAYNKKAGRRYHILWKYPRPVLYLL